MKPAVEMTTDKVYFLKMIANNLLSIHNLVNSFWTFKVISQIDIIENKEKIMKEHTFLFPHDL